MTSPPLPEPSRVFRPPPPSRIRDVDAFERSVRLRAALLSLAGVVIGGAVAVFVAASFPDVPFLLLAAIPLLCGAAVYVVTLAVVRGAGRSASTIYNPSGRGTPHLPEFSRAETLAVRGRPEEAVDELLRAAETRPEDARPLLRAARILRDDLRRFDDAAALFRRVRRERALDAGTEMLVTREIAEIHLHRTDRPLAAAPELSRLVERFPDSPEARWAERTLADVRSRLAEEDGREREGGRS